MDIEYVDIVQDITGDGNILASWEKYFIRVCENLTQNPRILYPLTYARTQYFNYRITTQHNWKFISLLLMLSMQ